MCQFSCSFLAFLVRPSSILCAGIRSGNFGLFNGKLRIRGQVAYHVKFYCDVNPSQVLTVRLSQSLFATCTPSFHIRRASPAIHMSRPDPSPFLFLTSGPLTINPTSVLLLSYPSILPPLPTTARVLLTCRSNAPTTNIDLASWFPALPVKPSLQFSRTAVPRFNAGESIIDVKRADVITV